MNKLEHKIEFAFLQLHERHTPTQVKALERQFDKLQNRYYKNYKHKYFLLQHYLEQVRE